MVRACLHGTQKSSDRCKVHFPGGFRCFFGGAGVFFLASLASLASELHLLSTLQLNLIPKKGGRGTVCPGKGGMAGGLGYRVEVEDDGLLLASAPPGNTRYLGFFCAAHNLFLKFCVA